MSGIIKGVGKLFKGVARVVKKALPVIAIAAVAWFAGAYLLPALAGTAGAAGAAGAGAAGAGLLGPTLGATGIPLGAQAAASVPGLVTGSALPASVIGAGGAAAASQFGAAAGTAALSGAVASQTVAAGTQAIASLPSSPVMQQTVGGGGLMETVKSAGKGVWDWVKSPHGSKMVGNVLSSVGKRAWEKEKLDWEKEMFEKNRQREGAFYGMNRDGTVAARSAPANIPSPEAPTIQQQTVNPPVVEEPIETSNAELYGSNINQYNAAFPNLTKGLLRS